ncbi:unnamed protein product [Natator depressus]
MKWRFLGNSQLGRRHHEAFPLIAGESTQLTELNWAVGRTAVGSRDGQETSPMVTCCMSKRDSSTFFTMLMPKLSFWEWEAVVSALEESCAFLLPSQCADRLCEPGTAGLDALSATCPTAAGRVVSLPRGR